MKVVNKHKLSYKGGKQTVTVPADVAVLGVQIFSDDELYLYTMGNPDTGEQELTLDIMGEVGGKVHDNYTHIGTFYKNKNAVHVFVVQ